MRTVALLLRGAAVAALAATVQRVAAREAQRVRDRDTESLTLHLKTGSHVDPKR